MIPSPTNDVLSGSQKQHSRDRDIQKTGRLGPFFSPARIQPKLSINSPGDEYEQEADAMADKVMRMEAPAAGLPGAATFFKPAAGAIQRKAHLPEDELDKEILHRKEMNNTPGRSIPVQGLIQRQEAPPSLTPNDSADLTQLSEGELQIRIQWLQNELAAANESNEKTALLNQELTQAEARLNILTGKTFTPEAIGKMRDYHKKNAEKAKKGGEDSCIVALNKGVSQLMDRSAKDLRTTPETIEKTMKGLGSVGLVSGNEEIYFETKAGKVNTGASFPYKLHQSVWDAIISLSKNDVGWIVFGLSLDDGNHSVTLTLDNNDPSAAHVYWSDQWESKKGWKEYTKTGLDTEVTHLIQEWWNEQKEGKKFTTVIRLWRLNPPSNPDAVCTPDTDATQIKRKCDACEEEEHGAQRKENNGRETTADSSLDNYVSSLNNSGQPLPESARSFFEPRFGQDFSNVRIHANNEAAQSAQSINALAYTSGNNIVFNNGQFSPESDNGKQLLAHELTHVIQQGNNAPIQTRLIQRDLAVAPTAPLAVGRVLTADEMTAAIQWNSVVFTDPEEIALIRELLGVRPRSGIIDQDFIRYLVLYQANYGLDQSGKIDSATALHLANELSAEATAVGPVADTGPAGRMAINPGERRMRLRSTVIDRLGTILHQGFIGPADHPTGIVTARTGFTDPAVAARDNQFGLNYTGANADNSHWLQFISARMSAIDPVTHNRVFNTISTTQTGGPFTFSDATHTNWSVDTLRSTNSIYYEAGGHNERTPGESTEIMDQPRRWNPAADDFAATFHTRPASVQLTLSFDDYLVVNDNSVVYHVGWSIQFDFNTATTPSADVRGIYQSLGGGAATGLPHDQKTVLDTQFPGNTVP
jgi:uncharacterized protein DUF4157